MIDHIGIMTIAFIAAMAFAAYMIGPSSSAPCITLGHVFVVAGSCP
jgi:hypothetical protein